MDFFGVGARERSLWANQACPPRQMTPLDDSPPVSTDDPPVCVLHRQLSRQRKAKYDGQIVLAFSPASTLALQVGPAHAAPARPPPPAPIPRAPP